jgi:hypothetical protein
MTTIQHRCGTISQLHGTKRWSEPITETTCMKRCTKDRWAELTPAEPHSNARMRCGRRNDLYSLASHDRFLVEVKSSMHMESNLNGISWRAAAMKEKTSALPKRPARFAALRNTVTQRLEMKCRTFHKRPSPLANLIRPFLMIRRPSCSSFGKQTESNSLRRRICAMNVGNVELVQH